MSSSSEWRDARCVGKIARFTSCLHAASGFFRIPFACRLPCFSALSRALCVAEANLARPSPSFVFRYLNR